MALRTNGATPAHKAALEDALRDNAIRYEATKRLKEQAELDFAVAEEEYVQAALKCKALGIVTRGVEFVATNDIPMKVTFMDGTGANSQVDEAALAKKLGARKWKTIVKEVIDTAKLKAEIAAGNIEAATVAMCTRVGDRKHYGRFTAQTTRVKATKVVRARSANVSA